MEPGGWFRAIILVAVCCIYSIIAAPTDPCKSYNRLPRAIYRGGKCNYVYKKEVCDLRLSFQWYRAVGLNGTDLEIQTTPAKFQTCGTKFPYWMNGTHPTVAEQEVSRTACMTDNTDCDKPVTIQVKNCTGFYVYKLRGTSSCSSGYCFGKDGPCPPFDPCDVYEYSEMSYDRGRSSVCDYQSGLCDTVNGSLWYRFEGSPQSLSLSSTCPNGLNGCGASQSIWANDTKVLSNGTEQLTVCTKSMGDCCKASHTILSKQCKSFRVYNFGGLPPNSCRRFCTDDTNVTCPLTTLSTSTGTTTLNTKLRPSPRREIAVEDRLFWTCAPVDWDFSAECQTHRHCKAWVIIYHQNRKVDGQLMRGTQWKSFSNQQRVSKHEDDKQRVTKHESPHEKGQQSVTKHVSPHNNGSTNHLWIIGAVAGVLVGVVGGVVVVIKLTKYFDRGKRVSDSSSFEEIN